MIRSGRIRGVLLHQVGRGDLFHFAFDIRRATFEAKHVILLQLQFGRIFNRDHTVVVLNERGQGIQQCRFARTGTTTDDDVQSGLDGSFRATTQFPV